MAVMVTITVLFLVFVSLPVKLTVPVELIVPTCTTFTFTVTLNCDTGLAPPFLEPPRFAEFQVTGPPAVPGAGPVQRPRSVGRSVVTDWKTSDAGSVCVKVTLFAGIEVAFLICHL